MKNKVLRRIFCGMLSAAVLLGGAPCSAVMAEEMQDGVAFELEEGQQVSEETGSEEVFSDEMADENDGESTGENVAPRKEEDPEVNGESGAEVGDEAGNGDEDTEKSKSDGTAENEAGNNTESVSGAENENTSEDETGDVSVGVTENAEQKTEQNIPENTEDKLTAEDITEDITDDITDDLTDEADTLSMDGSVQAAFSDGDIAEESCELCFDGNGSTAGSMDALTGCSTEGEIVLPVNRFSRTGYQFAGWNTAADGTGTTYRNGQAVTGIFSQAGETVILYAQWKANSYNIVFKGNRNTGGNTAPMKNCSYGDAIQLRKNTFTRSFHVFAGWNTRADGKGRHYSNGQKVTGLSEKNKGTVILYAQWRLKKYTVAFSGNRSTSGSMKNMACQYTKSYKLTSCKYKRTGYTFTGWNTRADGKGKTYKNTQAIRNLSARDGAEIKLYACWKKNIYKISYQLNGGKNAANPKTYTVTSNIILKKPSRAYYTFKGWYLDKALTKKVTKIAKGSTGNKTLYAKWSINRYTVQFTGNGGKGSMNKVTLKVGQYTYLPLGGFSRSGYYCTGWNTRADGKGKQYSTLQKVKNLSKKNGVTVKLYAIWKPLSKNESSMSKQVITQVNRERKAYGLAPLKTNSVLNGIAQQRAREIAQYFQHERPDGTLFFSMYDTAGYSYQTCGENIAYGQSSAASVMNDWMNSEGHRANILNSDFEEIGVGCYYENGIYYWVQNFGTQWNWNW